MDVYYELHPFEYFFNFILLSSLSEKLFIVIVNNRFEFVRESNKKYPNIPNRKFDRSECHYFAIQV